MPGRCPVRSACPAPTRCRGAGPPAGQPASGGSSERTPRRGRRDRVARPSSLLLRAHDRKDRYRQFNRQKFIVHAWQLSSPGMTSTSVVIHGASQVGQTPTPTMMLVTVVAPRRSSDDHHHGDARRDPPRLFACYLPVSARIRADGLRIPPAPHREDRCPATFVPTRPVPFCP